MNRASTFWLSARTSLPLSNVAPPSATINLKLLQNSQRVHSKNQWQATVQLHFIKSVQYLLDFRRWIVIWRQQISCHNVSDSFLRAIKAILCWESDVMDYVNIRMIITSRITPKVDFFAWRIAFPNRIFLLNRRVLSLAGSTEKSGLLTTEVRNSDKWTNSWTKNQVTKLPPSYPQPLVVLFDALKNISAITR